MKIGALIATKGNERELFINHCINHLLYRQTREVDQIALINHRPVSYVVNDQRERIAKGVEQLQNTDLILFIEDDDWYSPEYVETIEKAYLSDQSTLVGFNDTTYYHLKGDCRYMEHQGRSSLFTTAIATDKAIQIDWMNAEKFIDLQLWRTFNDKTLMRSQDKAVGIKHGISSYIGAGHETKRTNDKDRTHFERLFGKDPYSMYFYGELISMYFNEQSNDE